MKTKCSLVMRVVTLVILCPLVVLFPRNKRKILFGAWVGQQFTDNPKYFLRFLIDHKAPYDYYWFGNEVIKEDVEKWPQVHFVRMHSWQALWHVLTAKWAMWSINFDCDISSFPTFGKIVHLSFWHGPGFKGVTYPKTPQEKIKGNFLFRNFKSCLVKFLLWAEDKRALASFSTERMVKIMQYEAPLLFRPEMSRAFGTARIDYLIANRDNDVEFRRVREKYAKMLGLPLDKKWFLYMPTWRNGFELKYSFAKSKCIDKYQTILDKQGAILIEKQHPKIMEELGIDNASVGNIYVISTRDAKLRIDTQELLLACQRMITDYSSCSVDFMTLNRPLIYFMYDYDSYMVERGFEYSVDDVVAGPIAKDEQRLMQCMMYSDEQLLSLKAPCWRTLIEGETGHACERFAKWVGLL